MIERVLNGVKEGRHRVVCESYVVVDRHELDQGVEDGDHVLLQLSRLATALGHRRSRGRQRHSRVARLFVATATLTT